MAILLSLATLLAAPAALAERLPQQGEIDKSIPQEGPGQAMSGNELASLYLQSPQLVSNDLQENGIESVNEDGRYANPDLLFRERHSGQLLPKAQAAPPPPPEPPDVMQQLLPFLSALAEQR